MLALAVGTLLVVVTLGYVLYPLLFGTARPLARRAPSLVRGAKASEEDAVVALREIEFDRATGKLSDTDYAELKARYTERALSAMRETEGNPVHVDDAVEAAVHAYRARLKSCKRCGPRSEPDAEYCSTCGGYLAEVCDGCGKSVDEAGAAFCARCGRQLAA